MWEKALLAYCQHHDIPHLAMECGRELGEWYQMPSGAVGVEDLRAYFHGIFAKNPLSATDRLFFADYLKAGAAEVLPDEAAETFGDLLAKADLGHIYDAPAMGVHHALLRAVYGFSHGQAFGVVNAADAREDFYTLCDAASAVIDEQAGSRGQFVRTKEAFLQKLGPQADAPMLVAFVDKIEALASFPAPCL